MRILVTGANGFVGKHLVPYLREHAEVLSTDHSGDVDEMIELTEPEPFEKLVRIFKPEFVIHLAAQWGRVFGEDDPENSIRQNAIVTTHVARATGDARLVYASTSEIYGHHVATVTEDYVGFPTTIYGMTKLWGEQVCKLYHPENLTIARLSMPYGPGSPPGRGRRALDTFLWQANHGMPIMVHEGGARSWCYISDICEALMLVAPKTGVWHVGRDDDSRTMLEVAERACRLAGASTNLIQVVTPPADQVVNKRLSTKKLFDTGWRPSVSFEDGMGRVWEHIRHFDADGVYQ